MRTLTLKPLEESIERRKAVLGLTGNNHDQGARASGGTEFLVPNSPIYCIDTSSIL